ncbi:MAG: ABC transporter ATP-binding protein [Actinomycetaceae bacterium]|nr:ABC transporter ATP-binding protein [Actinomycetaceae bacterium]
MGDTRTAHATPAIEIDSLVVARGKGKARKEILHGVTADIPTGSITGLLGPSGCGKTTLIRTIVGAQKITSGAVRVLGQAAGSPSLRSQLAYTSQQLSIYPDITVAENVEYFAALVGADSASAQQALDTVDLEDYADRLVSTLSGGQASRTSLACALVGNPQVLVLDEPTVGLDPLTRQSLWATFRQLAKSGVTLLISSHVMDEARYCDSVLLMREGHFLAHEPLAALQERTSTANAEDAFLALIGSDDGGEV